MGIDISVARVHGFITGDVTGVGYRVWARKQAQELGVSGWVRNADRKTVELVAEGEKDTLEMLIERCKQGPEIAWVEDVQIQWQYPTGEFVGFEIRH